MTLTGHHISELHVFCQFLKRVRLFIIADKNAFFFSPGSIDILYSHSREESFQKIKRGLRRVHLHHFTANIKGKGSPYSITERRVPELIPVLGSQPAGDMSHKPGGRLPLLSARPAVTPATLKRAAISFAAW